MGYIRVHSDVHGNVVVLLDWFGAGMEKYTYDAFGKPKITDWSGTERAVSHVGNRFLFQGRDWIAELGVYDYRNRMYHPGLGRFLQTDPIGFDAGDMNLFRYCGDDPVNRSDPLGLDWGFLPDQYPMNFDNISAVPEKSKGANGYTARPIFSAVASIVPAGGGYTIKYADVNIRSQSYIRTHQRHKVGSFPFWGNKEDRLIGDDLYRTAKHEGRQKGIDNALYDKWHKEGTFKRMIEDGKVYSSAGKAGDAFRQNEKSARDEFETARRKQGRELQKQDGMYQSNHFVPSSAPNAADVDANHQATGVPSLGAETVNLARGAR